MNIFRTIREILFPVNLDEIFSKEAEERNALRVAARFSRNVMVQAGRVTTQRMFDEDMKRMAERVAKDQAKTTRRLLWKQN